MCFVVLQIQTKYYLGETNSICFCCSLDMLWETKYRVGDTGVAERVIDIKRLKVPYFQLFGNGEKELYREPIKVF